MSLLASFLNCFNLFPNQLKRGENQYRSGEMHIVVTELHIPAKSFKKKKAEMIVKGTDLI